VTIVPHLEHFQGLKGIGVIGRKEFRGSAFFSPQERETPRRRPNAHPGGGEKRNNWRGRGERGNNQEEREKEVHLSHIKRSQRLYTSKDESRKKKEERCREKRFDLLQVRGGVCEKGKMARREHHPSGEGGFSEKTSSLKRNVIAKRNPRRGGKMSGCLSRIRQQKEKRRARKRTISTAFGKRGEKVGEKSKRTKEKEKTPRKEKNEMSFLQH